ncbi:MAG: sigma-70 family RNA polymerase sigma factor [Ruminococcus sp.]|nr:sigma-70 family RNA polymerase sigma factor [Ruminococcus sp.]
MQHKKVFLTNENADMISYKNFESKNSNALQRINMKKIMKKAIKNELTTKQRYCLCEHFLKGRSMKSIARELDLNPSTVTRHIQNALSRLQRVAKYY